MHRLPLLLAFILAHTYLSAQTAVSTLTIKEQVSLTWDAPGGEITGYKLYIGNSPHTYGEPILVGNQTYFTVQGLTSGTYYFSVKAFNSSGDSDYSNEVSKTIPIVPPTGAQISAISVSAISSVSATIAWTTTQECSGQLLYGTTTPSTLIVANNLGTTEHLAIIPALIARTHYVFKVRSTCNGQAIESESRSFNTK